MRRRNSGSPDSIGVAASRWRRNRRIGPRGSASPDADSTERSRAPWALRRGVSAAVTAAALAGVAAVVLTVWLTRGADTVPGAGYPAGLQAVTPTPGAQVPRQSPVGARVEPGWAPTLIIDGTPIPPAQLDAGTLQLGEHFFAPGPGKAIEELPTGRVCAAVTAAPVTAQQAPDLVYEWCFTTF